MIALFAISVASTRHTLELPLPSWLVDRVFALTLMYIFQLMTLSVSTPSRFGAEFARYFNAIFLLLAVVSLFYGSSAIN
jgi:hypothetical protein